MVQGSSWLVYCGGACGSARARAAAILISPSGIKLCNTEKLQFTNEADKCTNNITEYEAILLGLCKFRVIGVQTCVLRIEKECIARETTLEKYLALVRRMENHFKGFTVEYIE
jgi:ribonuclease HI